MRRQTEFLMLVRQSAGYYTQQTLNSSSNYGYKDTNKEKDKAIERDKHLCLFKLKRINRMHLDSRKLPLHSFHKEYLHDKFLQTEYSLMTKSASNNNDNSKCDSSTKTQRKILPFFITKPNITINSSIPLTKREETKAKEETSIFQTSFYPISTDEYRLYSKSKLREESISQFMQKTEVISKAKYFLTIKKEIQKEVKESADVRIQSEEAKQKALIFNKKLLDVFSNNFIQYLKFLNQEVEKEKTVFKALESQHENLSSQIKTIKDKINSYKKQLIIVKDYKQFILLVKYHVTKISQLPIQVLIKHFGNDYCVRRPSQSPRSIRGRKGGGRYSIRKSDPAIGQTMDDLKIYVTQSMDFKSGGSDITEKEIFATPEEFDNEYKEIEDKVLKMFIQLTEKKRELNALKLQRDEVFQYKQSQDKISNDIIEDKEKKLMLLKKKNMYLMNEYDNAKQVFIEDTIKIKIKNKLQLMLLNVPINIEKDLNFPFAYDHIKTKNPVLLVFGAKINPTVYYLELLERILLVFIEKIREMKRNPKMANEYTKIKNALEVKKRILNSRLKIKAEKERREMMNEKILEKSNKLLYLQYRKTNDALSYFKMSQSTLNRKKKNKKKGDMDELSINDILYYD